MDEIFARFPHIGEQILAKLDNQTLTSCRQVSQSWRSFLDNGKMLWLRSITNYIEPTNSGQWKNFVKKSDVSKLTEIAHGVQQFYTEAKDEQALTPLGQGETPLLLAASSNHFDVCQLIIEQSEEKNPSNGIDGYTPLHEAAKNGNMKLCKLIIDSISDKNPKCSDGKTPLHFAAIYGHLAVCELMIHNVDEINDENDDGYTPLSLAAGNGHLRICQLIYENLSSHIDDKQWCLLLRVSAYGSQYEVCKFFVNEVRKKHLENVDSVLCTAARNGNLDICRLLVENLNVTQKSKHKYQTSLHVAAENGHFEVYKLIMVCFKDINPSDDQGTTPLHLAAEIGHFRLCELILSNTRNKNPRNYLNMLPIHYAVKNFRYCEGNVVINHHWAVYQIFKETIRNIELKVPHALSLKREHRGLQDADTKSKRQKNVKMAK